MARPTLSVSSMITADNQTLTPPANTRGMLVICHRDGAHQMTGVSHGGVALSAGHEISNGSNPALHICSFYIDNYSSWSGRSGNVLDFTGGTLGGTVNDDVYRAFVFWIVHATHTVVRTAEAEIFDSNSQTQPIDITINPGAGVDALGIVAATVGTANYSEMAGQANLYYVSLDTEHITDVAMRASWENITGSHVMGWNTGGGTNPRGVFVANAWTEGTLIPTGKPRVLIFG